MRCTVKTRCQESPIVCTAHCLVIPDLSFLSPKHQDAVIDLMGLNLKPTVKRVQRLRQAEKTGKLDDKTIRAILEDIDLPPVKRPEPPKPAPTQPDPPFPDIARAPPGFHIPDPPLIGMQPHPGLTSSQHLRYGLLHLSAIPFREQLFAILHRCMRHHFHI